MTSANAERSNAYESDGLIDEAVIIGPGAIETTTGYLTVAQNESGYDYYDFGIRAALIAIEKQSRGLDVSEPIPSPWTVEFEPTLVCNARCHFCSYESDIQNAKEASRANPDLRFGLSLETVENVLDQLRDADTTKGIFWSGGGDPLTWRHIVEGVTYASSFAQNAVQTNGILLNRFFKDPDNLAAVDLWSVSVYADNPELHFAIAGVDRFKRVTENIREARSLRERYGLDFKLTAKLLIDAYNYKRIPEITRFYKEDLGMDTVALRLVQDYNYGGEGERPVSVELSDTQKVELREVIGEAQYTDASLQALASSLKAEGLRPQTTEHCYNATDGHFACIDAWGDVYLGNPEIGQQEYKIGNIHTQDWSAIWNSERHHVVLAKMDEAQAQEICANALCRHVRANKGAEDYYNGKIPLFDTKQVMYNLGAFL